MRYHGMIETNGKKLVNMSWKPSKKWKFMRKSLNHTIAREWDANKFSDIKQKRWPDWGLNPGPSRHIPDALTTELLGLYQQIN